MRRGAGRDRQRLDAGATPAALIWSAALLAAPFLSFAPAQALPWGIGAALLLGVFPPVLVAYLKKRNDLRRFGPSSLPPVVLGAAALGFMLQRLILWLDGPLALSAAVFALLAAAMVLLVANAFTTWSWLDVTLGAALVIMPVTALIAFDGGIGLAGAATTGGFMAAAMIVRFVKGAAARHLIACGIGAVAGGGLFLWLLKASRIVN
ncbi:hypothetical protein LJ756_00015 [Arthrobacter sp. zg-Y411]|uniref:hypothetical protein n=1 Tax=Arthrobacter zhangbolii TaxID=2886936 RepID=UPI001D15D2E5|nr:hypothetical protein [Arthrobacter zhangbolii]MCC3293007.1 hypothetical protein [Arthrobacter zhangbolii]